MEAHIYNHKEERDRKLSALLTLLIHLFLFVILILPFFRYPIPPPGQAGILVSFGEENKGGEANPNQEISEELVSKPVEKEVAKTSKPDDSADVKTKIVSEEAAPIKASKTNNSTPKPKEKSAEELKKEREAEAEAKRAEEEARKKAEYESAKEEFGDLFGKGTGTEPGNQGDPNGAPDSDILEGISKGSGRVGGGLSNRGLMFEPEFKDNSQKEGKVVIKICVDKNGKVISTKFTQRGSTTTDSELVKIALDNSKNYLFSISDIEEQCGTITIDFKLI